MYLRRARVIIHARAVLHGDALHFQPFQRVRRGLRRVMAGAGRGRWLRRGRGRVRRRDGGSDHIWRRGQRGGGSGRNARFRRAAAQQGAQKQRQKRDQYRDDRQKRHQPRGRPPAPALARRFPLPPLLTIIKAQRTAAPCRRAFLPRALERTLARGGFCALSPRLFAPVLLPCRFPAFRHSGATGAPKRRMKKTGRQSCAL